MKSTIFVVAMIGLSINASAAEVVVNPGMKITAHDVRDIYLGEMIAVSGVTLQPLDNAAAQEKFATTILKLPIEKYQSIWTKKAFRDGLTAPALKKDDAEVIEFVKRTPGAIGYIEGSSPPDLVSILKF
mgnify:FL=1